MSSKRPSRVIPRIILVQLVLTFTTTSASPSPQTLANAPFQRVRGLVKSEGVTKRLPAAIDKAFTDGLKKGWFVTSVGDIDGLLWSVDLPRLILDLSKAAGKKGSVERGVALRESWLVIGDRLKRARFTLKLADATLAHNERISHMMCYELLLGQQGYAKALRPSSSTDFLFPERRRVHGFVVSMLDMSNQQRYRLSENTYKSFIAFISRPDER